MNFAVLSTAMPIEMPVHHPHSLDGWIFHWIHHYGYAGLFGVLLMCGVGLPLPEDIPLIASGFFIQRGEMNFALAAFCAWCGIIGGDCILYSLGRAFGAEVTKIPFVGRHINIKRMARVEVWFAHYGVWVVVIGRLFAGIRGAMVVVAGATRFNFIKFIIADSLAAVVSGGLFMFLGYKSAKHLPYFMHETLPHIKHYMMLGLVVLVLGLCGYVLWRRRQGKIVPNMDAPVDRPKVEVSAGE